MRHYVNTREYRERYSLYVVITEMVFLFLSFFLYFSFLFWKKRRHSVTRTMDIIDLRVAYY